MRVTIVTGAFAGVPPAPCGAVEMRWLGVARELAERGHQVTMVGRGHGDLPRRGWDGQVEVIRHTEYERTGSAPSNFLKDLAYALRIGRRIPTSDVLIINDFWVPIICSLIKWNQPFLVNVARVPKGQLFLYRRAKAFIVPSKAIEETTLAEGVDRAKIIKLGNPIDVTVFQPPRTPRTYAPPHRLLYAGRIHPEKGLRLLIDAVSIALQRGVELQCRIIGPHLESQGGGGTKYLDELKALASGLPIDFEDPIFERSALAEAYRWADLFVYPSIAERGESFGVAPVEAMGTGAIPIVSELSCFDEFMRDGVGAQFDHRVATAANELARAIETTIMRKDLPQQSQKASSIASRFSYPAIAQELTDALQSLLD